MKIILILKTCKSKKIAIKKKGLNLIENKTYGAWNHKKKISNKTNRNKKNENLIWNIKK
jgi:hypothetical protein